jgi:PAS domain S-box-containing protein
MIEALLALTHDIVVANDAHGRVHLFNAAAERALGYRVQEAREWLSVVDLFATPTDARRVRERLRGQPPGHVELLDTALRTRSGDLVPVSLAAQLTVASDGTPLVLGVAVDRREVLALQARLDDASGQVLESERRAASMAVSLRAAQALAQPLTAAMGHLELLAEDVRQSGVAREHADRAHLQLARIGRIAAELAASAQLRPQEGR